MTIDDPEQTFATEQEATAEARRRNAELGLRDVTDAFYIEVEQPDGRWAIEYRREKPRSRLEAVLDAVFSFPWPPGL